MICVGVLATQQTSGTSSAIESYLGGEAGPALAPSPQGGFIPLTTVSNPYPVRNMNKHIQVMPCHLAIMCRAFCLYIFDDVTTCVEYLKIYHGV